MKRRIGMSLRFMAMAALIGVALYMYNDWRTHQTLAAPDAPVQRKPQSTETPLKLPDEDVKGTVQLGPNGEITPLTGRGAAKSQQP